MNHPTAEQLAEAWRNSPGFGAPYWHDGRWVWLSPNGDARTRCGSPIRPPAEADIKPHQRQLWQKCHKCRTIRPWGGCGSKTPKPQWITWWGHAPKSEPELTELDSPATLLTILEKMAECPAFEDWLIEDEIVFVATKHFDFKTNLTDLHALLRPLYREGKIEHKRNDFGQNCFRLTGEVSP